MRSGSATPSSTSARPQATRSSKVLGLAASFPSSYQRRPISPPPRTWPMAKAQPRSSKESRSDEKRRVDRDLVRAVAVEERRSARRVGRTVDQADRDLRPVVGRRPQPARHVRRRVVATEHRLHLADVTHAGVEIEVDDGRRGDQRGVGEPELRPVHVVVGREVHGRHLLGLVDEELVAGREPPDPDPGGGLGALLDQQVVAEDVDALDAHAGRVRRPRRSTSSGSATVASAGVRPRPGSRARRRW